MTTNLMQATRWDNDHITTTLMNSKRPDPFFLKKITQVNSSEKKTLFMDRFARPLDDVLIYLAGIVARKGDPYRFSMGTYIECIRYVPMKSSGSHTVLVSEGSINLRTCKSP